MNSKAKFQQSSQKTLAAAKKFSRRTVLKNAAAAGVLVTSAPWLVNEAFSSSGILSIMIWSDYLPKKFVKAFTDATGIKIRHTAYSSNLELINKIKLTKGLGYDLVSPSNDQSEVWKQLDLLEAFDLNRVDVDKIMPSMLKISRDFSWDNQVRHLPYIWGSEGISWRYDLWASEYGKLSFGDLWQPDVKGRVMGRPYSMLSGLGRHFEHIGRLPAFRESYENEDKMRLIWDEIISFAIEHKPWIRQFWDDSEGQTNGLLHNGVLIGQTWGGPTYRLQKAGKPVRFMAPVEGAFSWLNGLSIPVGAQNKDAIYAFINFAYDPKNAALLSEETGYHTVSKGVHELLSEELQISFAESYPDNAMENLWAWPTMPLWYSTLRQEYSDRFVAA